MTTPLQSLPLSWSRPIEDRAAAVGASPAPRSGDQVVEASASVLVCAAHPHQAPPEFHAMVTRGGGTSELAERMWSYGVDAAGAVDALTLAMRAPAIEDFGPARLLVEILGRARAQAELTPDEVQDIFRHFGPGVVIQPDGVWVRAHDGAPLQVSPVTIVDGRPYSGDLPVGGLFESRGGVLYEASPDGGPGPVVGELGLTQDPYSAFITGVSEFLIETTVGMGDLVTGLAERPEETLTALVHGFGTMPAQVVEAAFDSPETLARFRRLPRHEQARAAGRIAGSLLLAARTAKLGASAAQSGGAATAALRVRVGLMDLGMGRTMPVAWVEGLGGFAGPGLKAAGAGAGGAQAILRSRDGDLDDPRVRFANEHHIRRSAGNPAEDTLSEMIEWAKDLDAHPNTQRQYARMARERLESMHGPVPLEDVTGLYRALRPEGRAELEGWVHKQFRAHIDEVGDVRSAANRNKIEEIARLAREAEVDLHKAYRVRSVAPPLSSLSEEARAAVRAIRDGAKEVYLASRETAEQVLSQYPKLAQTGGWPKWKTKALLEQGMKSTFHWDDLRGPGGRVVGHGPDNPHGHLPHLQFHHPDLGGEVTLFFPW